MFFFKSYGLLGQNARNLDYIKEYNTKVAKRLADSKLKTKEFLKAKGIAVPETLFVFKKHEDIKDEIFDLLTPPFVIKPNGGFGGKGIIIIIEKDLKGNFVTNTKKVYTQKDLKEHFYDILDGFYSLSGHRDKVVIEKKIELGEEIELLGKFGLPDIRVITFNMVPVMAMLRVPTAESHGKANLHAGACGVGIEIGTGKLTYITKRGKIIKSIPGIGDVRGIEIPDWDKILTLVVKVQQVTNVGYLGCDIVLDKNDGPLLLEMNIRPGLEVQVANIAPLKDRLERVEGIYVNTVEKGVRLGKDLFSGDIEEKIKSISGKKVVGGKEYLKIKYNEKTYKYLAEVKLIDSKSFMDIEFAKNVLKLSDDTIESGTIKLDIELLGEFKKVKFVFKELGSVNIILGLNALKGFLIDPFKYKKGELPHSDVTNLIKGKNEAIRKNYTEQLIKIDNELINIDKKLIILKHFTPINLLEEKEKFIKSGGEYVPQFKYEDLNIDLDALKEKIEKIEIPDIPLSGIYSRKKDEIKYKIALLKAFKNGVSKDITFYSRKIYGDIHAENLEYTNNLLSEKSDIKEDDEFLTFEEIKAFVRKFNHIYDIKIHLKKGNRSARFVLKGDNLLIRGDAQVGKKEMRAIIAHEIEGHYLRRLNGKNLAYSIFGHGTNGYLEIDEGIAIFNQNRFLGEIDKKYYGVFERYYFVNYALKHSYRKLVDKMIDYYDSDLEKVFNYLTRLKRGLKNISEEGIFMKDVVYVNGYLKVDHFVSNGGNLKELYLGKINIDDLTELKDGYFLKINFNDSKVPFFL
ncbi:MAG: DUF1704 domain-containing protein [Candidatus Gracilibacteria bacterium]|nr:DUF1704 domain-containing protein [Candidatus Gracilibacteria bacterium]